jgi:hypothetical protein
MKLGDKTESNFSEIDMQDRLYCDVAEKPGLAISGEKIQTDLFKGLMTQAFRSAAASPKTSMNGGRFLREAPSCVRHSISCSQAIFWGCPLE